MFHEYSIITVTIDTVKYRRFTIGSRTTLLHEYVITWVTDDALRCHTLLKVGRKTNSDNRPSISHTSASAKEDLSGKNR